ncbi:Zorya protein ZorC EH domain-containing protein [Kosakonia sp. BK9b]
MNWTSPVTPDCWESKLIDYFLRFRADGDAQDIRWFEATPTTLAAAFADSGVSADEAEEAFRTCMSKIRDLPQRLESGMMEKSTRRSPGYFTYLIMTLLISSQFDAQDERNDFRLKLQNWLQVTHSFQNLSGINKMWEALAEWLRQRIQEGEPYRRLILPPRDGWVQIGHTLRLAFPNKADLRLMSGFLESHSQAAAGPRQMIEYFQIVIQREKVSHALRQAFTEFRDAWILGRRALFDMPFWRLRQRAVELSSSIATHRAIIDMCIDFDGSRCYFSADDENGESIFHKTLSEALKAASTESSDNLAKAMKAGLIFFHQTGHGRWKAKPSPDEYSLQFHIALSSSHSVRMSERLESYVDEGEWILTTQPLKRVSAIDIFRAVKSSSGDDEVTRPQLYGGIRVPGGWLGLPAFLPSIESDTQRYKIYSPRNDDAAVDIYVADGRLISSSPLNGEFFIEPAPEVGEKTTPWRRRTRFFSRALPHPTLGESARYRFTPLSDWSTSSLKVPTISFEEPFQWENSHVNCEHLMEAIYASGTSGWEEVELVAIMKRVTDDISVWHLIRCLHHAGLIEPRLRPEWKGRVWTLVKPTLLLLRNGENSLVVVEGAVCAILMDDFQKAVAGLGGKSFRRSGISVWSPPVFGAVLADPVTLSQRMGWPLIDASSLSDATPFSLAPAERAAELHNPAAVWNWRSGSFQTYLPPSKSAASLSLHVHPGGRDHDIYRVVSGRETRHFLSRTAAIINAGAKNRQPIFERVTQNHLLCLIHDCGLPDALATGIRRSALRNGGPMDSGYVYPIGDASFLWLKSLLPGSFCLLSPGDEGDANHLVSAARHSGGKKRPIWRNGRLTLTPGS